MRHDVIGDRRVGWNAILGIVLICLGVAMPALAATSQVPERWAAISLVGDRMNLIYARSATGTTGSSTNPNRIEAVPTRSDVLDRLVLRAVLDTTVPGNPEIVALAVNDPALYQAQDKLFPRKGGRCLKACARRSSRKR